MPARRPGSPRGFDDKTVDCRLAAPALESPLDAVRSLHERLLGLYEELEQTDLRELEETSETTVLLGERDRLEQLVDGSIVLLKEILGRYDSDPTEPHPEAAAAFGRGVDRMVEQYASEGRLADLAFIATVELRQKRERLSRLAPGASRYLLLSAIASTRRRLKKSLTAVSSLLCRLEAVGEPLSFESEVQSAVAIRRGYARLCRTIARGRDPGAGLESRLRDIKTELTILMGRAFYPDLRLEDRVALRESHGRLIAWLARPPSASTNEEGRRLWTDICGVANELSKISRRQELLEHDAHVLRIAAAALEAESAEELAPGLLRHLGELEGLDPDVDRLLRSQTRDAAAWRRATGRLRMHLPTVTAAALTHGGWLL